MSDIYERFQSLPRGRKGTKAVVIVEEVELARLIADAQAAEGALMARAARAHRDAAQSIGAPGVLTTFTGGATGGAPMQIHVEDDRPTPSLDRLVVERAPWLRDPHAP